MNNLDEMLEYEQENGENLNSQGEQAADSSCSFEDIDTEVIREMDLSRGAKHIPNEETLYQDNDFTARYDQSNSCARGVKHIDSLRTSTVFEELAGENERGLTTPMKNQQSAGSLMVSKSRHSPPATSILKNQL